MKGEKMRKIVTLIGSVVLVGLLSGCGNDYKCDSKDYAEQALNLLFFEDAKGGNDKRITLKTLGFEVGEITLMNLDKDKKSSVCKAKITNKNVESALQLFDEFKKTGKYPQHYDEDTKKILSRLTMNAGLDGIASGILAEELLRSLKISKEEMSRDEYQVFLAMGVVALNLQAYGLAYRTYDNGNGDLMIEADIAK